MSPYRIAIIGGGCSGVLTAINLLRTSSEKRLHITLVEKSPQIARGLAYAVPSDRCKLNVPVSGMSAFSDDPENFLRWMRSREPTVAAEEFVSRRFYGEYLAELLDTHRQASRHHVLEIFHDEVVDLELIGATGTFLITLKQSKSFQVDACILAVGNIERSQFGNESDCSIFHSPYLTSSYEGLSNVSQILIVGTGLTAIDCVLEAEARGFRGRYTMLSRHARLPLPHEVVPTSVDLQSHLPHIDEDVSLRSLVRTIHSQARIAGSSQGLMLALRPHIQTIWHHLSTADKSRFLRHIRPFWEVHRHRIPQPHHETVLGLIGATRLEIVRGKLRSACSISGRTRVTIASSQVINQDFDRAFLCAGPESDLTKVTMPLVRKLIERKIIIPGDLKLGVAPGVSSLPEPAQKRFRIIGPLQREELWEITAVRELRIEAERVAQEIAQYS